MVIPVVVASPKHHKRQAVVAVGFFLEKPPQWDWSRFWLHTFQIRVLWPSRRVWEFPKTLSKIPLLLKWAWVDSAIYNLEPGPLELLLAAAAAAAAAAKSLQLCPTLCDPMDYTVHEIF